MWTFTVGENLNSIKIDNKKQGRNHKIVVSGLQTVTDLCDLQTLPKVNKGAAFFVKKRRLFSLPRWLFFPLWLYRYVYVTIICTVSGKAIFCFCIFTVYSNQNAHIVYNIPPPAGGGWVPIPTTWEKASTLPTLCGELQKVEWNMVRILSNFFQGMGCNIMS